jgi:hypothetical protein
MTLPIATGAVTGCTDAFVHPVAVTVASFVALVLADGDAADAEADGEVLAAVVFEGDGDGRCDAGAAAGACFDW